MGNTRERLTSCFWTVFPDLSAQEISNATSATVQAWDSVAGVTLLALVEEEFGISIEVEVDDLTRFNSFHGFLDYLQERAAGSHSLL